MNPKLSPPTPSRLLQRQRLHQRLDAAAGSVAWLIAPAGSGKTSLLASWARCREEPLIWFRVDRGDRDPARFFKALTEGQPASTAQRLPAFEPEHLIDLAGFTQRYLRAWYATAPADAVIVLDNLHEASNPDGSLAWFLTAMILEKPPETTLVISSRQAPEGQALALAATPDHARLDYADLRCSDDEARLLARQLGLAAPSPDLLASADGWMAGLSLLMRVEPDTTGGDRTPRPDASAAPPANDIPCLSTSALFESFAARAFEALPASSQDLLLAHAFSPCIRPESADRLLGVQNSGHELESLWRAHFFVERRVGSDRQTDYLCHPLLRAFLQDRILRRWAPSALAALWRRQAEELAALGDHDAAIDLWLQAGDREAAARLLLADAPTLLAEGHQDSWLDRLARLGEPPPAQLAELAHWEGNFRRLRSPSKAIACQRRACEAWAAEGRLTGQLLAVSAIIHTIFSRSRDWNEAVPWIEEAQRLDAALLASPEGLAYAGSEAECRALACGYSITLMFPGHPLLRRWYARACELLQSTTWGEPQQNLSSFVMCYAWWHGNIHVLRDVSRQALHALRNGSVRFGPQLTSLLWIVTSGNIDGLACDAERRGALDMALELCEGSGLKVMIQHAGMRAMHAALTRRDHALGERARAHISAGDAHHPATRGLMLISLLAHQQLLHNWDEVIAQSEHVLADDPSISNWLFGGHVVRVELAQVLAHVGDHDRADHWAREILAFSKTHESPSFEMLATLVLAAGALARDDTRKADQLLRHGFGMARVQGYRALPCAPTGYTATLAARALVADIESAWVRQLVREQQLPAPEACLPRWPYRIRIEVLGPFRLFIDDQLQARPGRAQQRVLELLKALASQSAGEPGRPVDSAALARAIWSDSDDEAAQAALDIALHRARKLLGDNASLVQRDGLLSLNTAIVDVDLWHCQQLLQRIGAATDRSADQRPSSRETRATELDGLARELVRSYPEPLLTGEKEHGWLLATRRNWQRQLAASVQQLAQTCLAHGRTMAALDALERALEDDPQSAALNRLHDRALAALGPSAPIEADGWSGGGPISAN